MTQLVLNGIGHAYFGRTILDDIHLEIGSGEIVALLGPSGCGKSTLAHIAAGLIEPRAGRIERHYVRHAMVFQDPALMPWATARQNIDYALKLARVPANRRISRLEEAAETVALTKEDLAKYPIELSGGMRQRVAIARALSVAPDFVFFDEPFTALDVALRRRMQDLVIETCSGGTMAGLFITHDLMEAARIAHRVAVLDTRGAGIVGDRRLRGAPGDRADNDIYQWVQQALETDPAFRHIHDVDERQLV